MKNKVFWLRLAYWIGLLVDGIVFVKMLVSGDYEQAPLMLGWTALLFWGDRKPVERRGVLWLTLVPVLAGYSLVLAYDNLSGIPTAFNPLVDWTFKIVYSSLILFSLGNSRGLGLEA